MYERRGGAFGGGVGEGLSGLGGGVHTGAVHCRGRRGVLLSATLLSTRPRDGSCEVLRAAAAPRWGRCRADGGRGLLPAIGSPASASARCTIRPPEMHRTVAEVLRWWHGAAALPRQGNAPLCHGGRSRRAGGRRTSCPRPEARGKIVQLEPHIRMRGQGREGAEGVFWGGGGGGAPPTVFVSRSNTWLG